MYKGQEIVNLAEKQLGTRGAEAKKYCGLPSGANYCDALVTWLFYKEGVKNLFCNGTKQTYCPTSMKLCYKELADIPIYIALPGDVIFFDWEPNGLPNHIGIVRERVSDLEIDTVEGNTSGYGTTGVVANKTRTYYIEKTKKVQIPAVFRPHFSVEKAEYDVNKPLVVDGLFGFNTIALTQKLLGITVDAILGKGTVKALQKIAGTPADGSWGPNTTKAIQKMVGTKVDGFFGPASCRAYQQWLNKHADFTPTPEKPKTYTGEFPNIRKPNGDLIGNKANELAYKDTASSKAKYPGGKPTEAFKKALNKVYPDRSSWGKAPKVGASCDVFVGTCVRASGYDSKFPRGLEPQIPYLKDSGKYVLVSKPTVSTLKNGDIIVYVRPAGGGHICIYHGGKIKEADYEHWYGRTTNSAKNRLSVSGKKWVKVYRAKGSYEGSLHMGDSGSEVKKLQKFLNWYGSYKLDVDGHFGVKTEDAVKKFQKAAGLTADGYFGPASLAKAKEIKK